MRLNQAVPAAAAIPGAFRNARLSSVLPYILLLICAATALVWAALRTLNRVSVAVQMRTVPADGRDYRIALLSRPLHLPLGIGDVQAPPTLAGKLRTVPLDANHVGVYLRAPVAPASLQLSLLVLGRPVRLTVTAITSNTDRVGDGMPDWMRLHSAEDRHAFRDWFTHLAVQQADAPADRLPAEILDCASLLRFCYRQALLLHDDRWYKQFAPGEMPVLPSVQQWNYPSAALGAGLFRILPGPFATGNASGAFAQFADAKTLYSRNAFFIGKDLASAIPGDLLFFHQLEQNSQYHSMIVTGEKAQWIVYHTGPIDGHRGEMRRVLLADLLHHPDARWHPVASNPNFLGVYRWNLLRED